MKSTFPAQIGLFKNLYEILALVSCEISSDKEIVKEKRMEVNSNGVVVFSNTKRKFTSNPPGAGGVPNAWPLNTPIQITEHPQTDGNIGPNGLMGQAGPMGPMGPMYTFRVRKTHCLIFAYRGNIASTPVDIIVNAANSQLQHMHGVAALILASAGIPLQLLVNKKMLCFHDIFLFLINIFFFSAINILFVFSFLMS